MWQRFTWYDVRVICHYLGVLISVFAIALAVPLAVAVVCQEWEPACRYLLAVGVALIVGSLLRFMRIQPGRLTHQQALAVTGLSWIVLAFVAAIPLAMSDHYGSFLDALFEATSGLTTTGASMAIDLEHMSYADNMWRFTMHLIGGLGLIVVALSLGLFGKATSGLYSSEGRSEHVLPNIVNTVRLISQVALVVIGVATVVLFAFCLISGFEPLRALFNGLWVAISCFTTAGFTPTSQSAMYYHSFPFEVVCMLLMLLGAVNFALYVKIRKGETHDFFKDYEIRTGVVWMVVGTIVLMFSLCASGGFSDIMALLRRGVFMVVSAATTAGFQTITNNQMTTVFSSGAFLVVAILMAVGGSSGSTSGGIKFSRLGLIAKSMVSTIKETLAPNTARVSVRYYHLGKKVLTTEVAKTAMTVSALFVLTYLAGALVGIAHGYDALSAIFESVAMASNGGLSSGIIAHGMPPMLESVYILEMWAGRLEFVTLIALIVKVVVSCGYLAKDKINSSRSDA